MISNNNLGLISNLIINLIMLNPKDNLQEKSKKMILRMLLY